MICVTQTGGMLPAQLIFEGADKGRVCPDSSKHAATITTTCTDNHWANVASTLEFLELIVTRRSALIDADEIPPLSPALLVWDVFYAHRDKAVLDFCRAKNIFLVFVPANCTSFLQVCDVSVNKPWKTVLARSFQDHVVQTMVDNPDMSTDAVAKQFTAKKLRELSLDYAAAAIKHITADNGRIIMNGIRRIGLDTIYDRSWEAMWTDLERTGSLWKSFSRNDTVVREGRVLDVVNNPVPTAAELAAEHEDIVDAMGLGANFLAAEYDDGVLGDAPAGGEVGDETLPPFAGIAAEAAAAAPADDTAAAATAATAAAKPPPPKRRKVGECSVCKVTTHRLGKSGEPCHAVYLEQKRKKAAAKRAATERAASAEPDSLSESD